MIIIYNTSEFTKLVDTYYILPMHRSMKPWTSLVIWTILSMQD